MNATTQKMATTPDDIARDYWFDESEFDIDNQCIEYSVIRKSDDFHMRGIIPMERIDDIIAGISDIDTNRDGSYTVWSHIDDTPYSIGGSSSQRMYVSELMELEIYHNITLSKHIVCVVLAQTLNS